MDRLIDNERYRDGYIDSKSIKFSMRIKESGHLSEEKEARIGDRYPGNSICICQCNSLFL